MIRVRGCCGVWLDFGTFIALPLTSGRCPADRGAALSAEVKGRCAADMPSFRHRSAVVSAVVPHRFHTPASKTRARPHAAQYPAYRGPVFGPVFAWRNRRAFVWFSVLRFDLGVPNPTFLAFCRRQARQPAPARSSAHRPASSARRTATRAELKQRIAAWEWISRSRCCSRAEITGIPFGTAAKNNSSARHKKPPVFASKTRKPHHTKFPT